MKLLIASDIHGSRNAVQALRDAISREKADRVFLLGDLLYHGPRNDIPEDYDPKAAIDMLNVMKDEFLCIRGNCDSEVDAMVLDFPIRADYAWACTEDLTLFLTHGHLYDPETFVLRPGEVFVSGHTHLAGHHAAAGHLCVNPGSMGIPKGGTPAGYITCEGRTILWHHLDGTVYDTLLVENAY